MRTRALSLLLCATLCAACSTPAATTTDGDADLAEKPQPLEGETKDDATEPAEPEGPMKWVWTDYEVVGHRSVTREQILEDLPFTLGEEAQRGLETNTAINAWCAARKEALGLYAIDCGLLRFGDGKTYVTVNVLEEEDARKLTTRAKPTAELTIPAELDATYARLYAIQEGHFDSGNYKVLAEEVTRPDGADPYLTYPKEPEMAKLAAELAAAAPAHRDALRDATARAADPAVRARAATLLNWAGDTTKSVEVAHLLLDDPSGLVRNNLSRFMLHYIPDVDDPELQGSLARVLAVQATRPSHPDRNKALYGLLYIAQSSEPARALVMKEAGDTIRRLAEQSRLPNVGEVAEQILALEEGAE
jgi:hypothetical protein